MLYSITISESKFVTTIYDKRDNFNFHIINFPYLDSNIPTRPAYGIYISQLVRIARICVKYSSFAERNRHITSRLVKQGFHYSKLCDIFKKFSRTHKHIFIKYGVSVKQHILDGICQPLCVLGVMSRNITTRPPRRR